MKKIKYLWILLILTMFFACGSFTAFAEPEDAAADTAQEDDTQEDGTPEEGTLDYVNAEAYVNGYYPGVINDSVSTTVNVRSGPGSDKYPVLKTSGGKDVKLKKGTSLTVKGETKDSELELWYHIEVEFDGEMIDGYCCARFIDRSEAQITFTPTPTPSPTVTPEPTPTIEGVENVFNNDNSSNEDKEEMLKDGKGMNPWKYILILCIVVILFVIIYTVVTRSQEKKLEQEMERYSKHGGIKRLEGERDEDFAEAKQDYYDRIKLGTSEDRDLGQEMGTAGDDIELDLNGIFDEDLSEGNAEKPAAESKEPSDGTKMSLYEKVMREAAKDEEEEILPEINLDFDENAPTAEKLAHEVEAVSGTDAAGEPETAEQTEDADAFFEEGPVTKEIPVEAIQAEVIASEAEEQNKEPEVQEPAAEEPAQSQEEILLAYLNGLRERDTIKHRIYGEGEVIDNSDAEVIQVRFGRDLRYLKKAKLAKRELVEYRG